jgi:hypothetical protein
MHTLIVLLSLSLSLSFFFFFGFPGTIRDRETGVLVATLAFSSDTTAENALEAGIRLLRFCPIFSHFLGILFPWMHLILNMYMIRN